MKTEEYVYEIFCKNCGLNYSYKYKDDSLLNSSCPQCKANNQTPEIVKKIETKINESFS